MRGVTEMQINICENTPAEVKEEFERVHGTEFAVKPVEFIFDDQNEAGLRALQFWGPLKARLHGPHLTVMSNTPQFKKDDEVVPLQAADMLAWHIRRQIEYPHENRMDIFSLINPSLIWEKEVSRDDLVKIVHQFNNTVAFP
jgi:Protein of unknown function (DUF3800)